MFRPFLLAAALVLPLASAEARDVQGGVAHAERIALAPDAVLVVEIIGRDGVVAEARIPSEGRQVPLPFRLTDVPDAPLLLRAAVQEGGAITWLAEVIEIGAGSADVMLPILPLRRHAAAGFATTFACGAKFVTAGFAGDAAILSMAGESRRLGAVESASGARFSDGAGNETAFWSKGDAATVTWFGVTLPECRAVTMPEQSALIARGNEPGWRLDMSSDGLRLTTEAGQTGEAAMLPPAIVRADAITYVVPGWLIVDLLPGPCSDTMTGMPYPLTAAATPLDSRGMQLLGCAGDPQDLLRGVWRVLHVDGDEVPGGADVTMEFAEGRVAGRSGCNRYMAGIEVTGESLRFTQAAGTMMACPPDVMTRERAFLDALSAIDRFEIDGNGVLLFMSADRPRIRAAR
ncbi:MAG: META domain-containing protein [Paracoccaceae bacterium]|nr:MAG: META domain-containing protein [Paracoccaceae bacterium]